MNFTKIEANHVSDNQTLYDQVKEELQIMIMSKSIMILTTALTTRIAIIVSLAIAMSSVVLPVLFRSEQQQAVAQQQGNNITTNATTPITPTQVGRS